MDPGRPGMNNAEEPLILGEVRKLLAMKDILHNSDLETFPTVKKPPISVQMNKITINMFGNIKV